MIHNLYSSLGGEEHMTNFNDQEHFAGQFEGKRSYRRHSL